jgi:integrase
MDQLVLSTLYRNFNESLNSDETRKIYNFYFSKFLEFIGGEEKLLLRDENEKLIESQIIDYIVSKRKQNYSHSYISSFTSAIFHFYTMNDINLNRKKICRFMGANQKKFKDMGYTGEQISKLLEHCDDRFKAIFLIFSSTGIRLGALPSLKLKHLKLISHSHFKIYQFTIYEGSKEEYITFCTPECTKAIDSYLSYRERSGEKLQPNSPLIREQFDRYDIIKVKHAKHIAKASLSKLSAEKLRQAGIREILHSTELNERSKHRKDVPLVHGFRKFFNTALMNADVHPTFKKLLMGHTTELDEVYYDKNSEKSQAKLLEEYSKGIDYLTINEENRLREKVEVLKAKRDEIEMLKGQVQQKDDRLSVIEKQMQSLVSTLSKLTNKVK